MDQLLAGDFNKNYAKYKSTVKKWEKEFVKLNGRIPSKHDIKEAPSRVKYAYKSYFNFKSEVLETSLMDVPLDEDEENFSLNDIITTESQESDIQFYGCNTAAEVFHVLPTTEEIKKLMNGKERITKGTSNVKEGTGVWGSHLNNKNIINPDEKINKELNKKSISLSNELFKSCNFNKRNPRKSLSSQKSLSKIELNKDLELKADISVPNIEKLLNDNSDRDSNMKKNEDVKSLPINPIQAVMSASNPILARNIDSGWLARCSEILPLQDFTPTDTTEECLDQTQSLSTILDVKKSMNFGLKNIVIDTSLPVNTDYHSDFVENSESEEERPSKKIRPAIKKIKIDSEFMNNLARSKNIDTKCVEKSSLCASILTEKFPVINTIKSKRKVVQSKKKDFVSIDSSDSEIDDPSKRKKAKNTKGISKVDKQNSKQIEKEFDDVKNQYEEAYIHGDDVSMPRFLIQQSVLKDHNLVDGLAAALKKTRNIKNNSGTKLHLKDMDDKEKLKKKIENGSLNENFVKINIEKKVFVRGKKTVNYSKFKKQQWKNKKKMLHNTPEFPEGGVLKCFKCKQTGHMARYCRAHKGGELLALEDCHEKSQHISLQDIQKSSDNITKVREDTHESFSFEPITQVSEETSENNPEIISGINKEKRSVPETFLKLLATSSKGHIVTQEAITPLYSLSSDGSILHTPDEVEEALNLFGHINFRSGQETAVMRILSGQSTLVTLSTGSGKSLCYQLPAYLYAQYNKCITLVISPLVSLMEDQVTNMPKFLHAACLHTNQSPTQREKIIDQIKNGDIHILLISPEAIVAGEKSTGFGSILRQLPPIAFACIDEVHCVSQWSHNFRPSYLMICRVLREKLGVKCVLGLTATATKPTILNIVQHLEIKDGVDGVVTNLPLPDNLILSVSRDDQRDRIILELLRSERFLNCYSIVIYCIRRDECERVAGLIRASMQVCSQNLVKKNDDENTKKRKRNSWLVEAYHAGMSAAKRRKVQQAFMLGELRIVVATVAFGMGIDKSDIRGVIHYNMPSSFESYVQEVGRAGRDGLPAQCHVFIDSNCKDKDELLKHIHANSIERHVIRKLLKKVFIPCNCKSVINDAGIVSKIQNIENTCQGHEVAFSVDETVAELDIPSENIATLLCYLELHPKKYAKNLSNAYIICKIISYGGSLALLKAAEKCAPLAMALALEKNKKEFSENSGTLQFCVIEIAAAIGWDSGMVKYHLKNLEWDKQNGRPKKSLLRVEFNTLGFRIKSPGDLTPLQLDEALDSIYERTQLQEKTMLYQLQEVSKSLIAVSYPSIFECSVLENEEAYLTKSNLLKNMIRSYFMRESLLQAEELDQRSVNEELVISDVRGLISTYRDCTFTGRAIARILQGISSPNFPAIVWGRCRYWRSHISADFYKLTEIAKQQIILMR